MVMSIAVLELLILSFIDAVCKDLVLHTPRIFIHGSVSEESALNMLIVNRIAATISFMRVLNTLLKDNRCRFSQVRVPAGLLCALHM